jgi:hypothetical protein
VRASAQRSLVCVLVGLTAGLSGRVLAQSAEGPEEIVVRAKPLNRYRAEIELARDEMIKIFNEANEGEDNDVECRYEAPTGSRIPERVCFSFAQDRAGANGARDFLNALFTSSGKGTGVGAPQVTAEIGAGVAQSDATLASNSAMIRFEAEWQRLMNTNRQFYDAVVKYRELENEFDRARGATVRIPVPVFALKGPQCEASTYTEYQQLGNVARVTGTVSISACAAGTTGKFALVARVRDEAGAVTPLEFNEMWQSDDAQDYVFFADYPIGDDVFLESVRVRNLTCTCEDPVGAEGR